MSNYDSTQTSQVLAGFNESEKTAYLATMASLVTADRTASDDELELLDALCEGANLSDSSMKQVAAAAQDPANTHLSSHLNQLRGSHLRFSLVADLQAFAESDGNLDETERQRIAQIAQHLDVNQQQYQALTQVVHKAAEQPEAAQSSSFLDKLGLGDTLQRNGINGSKLMNGLLLGGGAMMLGRMLSGGRRGQNPRSGGMLGSILGGLGMAGGAGALGSMLGGGQQQQQPMGGGMGGLGGGLGSLLGGGGSGSGGGLGSIFNVLSGNRGYRQSGMGGGLGSLLGGLLGGNR